MFSFLSRSRPHAQTAISDHPLLVLFAPLQQESVQLLPTPYLRQRHQVIPPIESVLRFHAAFLVPFTRRAKLRFVSPVRPERNEPLALLPLRPAHNPLHSAAQII